MRMFMVMALSLLITVQVDAQSFGNKLKNKVINKLENKADEKIDKSINSAVDKPVDKTEEKVKESVKNDEKGSSTSSNSNSSSKSNSNSNSSSSQQGQPSQEDMAKYMEMMGGGAVSMEDYPDIDEIVPSSFVGSFDMYVTTTKNGKAKDDGMISWYIDKYDVVMIPQMENNGKQAESKIIINRKKGVMTMLTNDGGKKSGIVMKMKTIVVDLSKTDVEGDNSDMNVQILKNEKQTINGYPCYKVLASNDEMESEAWVTEKIALNMQQMFSFMDMRAKGDNNAYDDKIAQIEGWPIKTISKDKKTGEVTTMEMKNIKDGYIPANITSTEGYSLMQLPDFGGFPGQ